MNRRQFTRTLGFGALFASGVLPVVRAAEGAGRKLLVVGDAGVGKTCLLITYCTHSFPDSYVPTVFDRYDADLTLDDRKLELGLNDTANRSDYDQARLSNYEGTDVIVVCYAVDAPASLEHVTTRWVPEIRRHRPGAPFLLVGCKADLRGSADATTVLADNGLEFIPPEAAAKVQAATGAAASLECSAKAGSGLTEIFERAARLVFG